MKNKYGKERLYLLENENKVEYVKNNYDILNDVDVSKVKQMEEDYYANIYVLMSNGELYKDKKIILSNVDRMFFLNADFIFAITKENEVINLNKNNSRISKYLSNDGCKYKKIVNNPTTLACLTEDGNVRAVNNEQMVAFFPENFKNVTDITVIEENMDIIVYHGTGKIWNPLYINDL